jgi:hypothetical protein
MTILSTWAARHNIDPRAIADLQMMMTGAYDTPAVLREGQSESAVQSLIRLEASRAGARLWRNNSGAGKLENGSFVRWGLANDSEALNRVVKSSDLIGIRPVVITQQMVGTTIGQFLAREVKHAGWAYRASDREVAQLKFITIVNALGGDAAFCDGEGSI